MTTSDIHIAELTELISRWWFHYDQGDFAALRELLHEDMHFSCSSDTGETDFEEFIQCDLHGVEEVMAWQSNHRLHSPYPLRHNGTNIHTTGRDGDATHFASYIFVTKVVNGMPHNISSGIVTGTVVPGSDHPVFRSMSVVLDTMDSLDHLPSDQKEALLTNK